MIKITRENNEEVRFFKLEYQCQSILSFNFHVSRLIDVIEKQNDDFFVYIVEFALMTQSIHDSRVKINS